MLCNVAINLLLRETEATNNRFSQGTFFSSIPFYKINIIYS